MGSRSPYIKMRRGNFEVESGGTADDAVSCGKMAELIHILFWVMDSAGPKETCVR